MNKSNLIKVLSVCCPQRRINCSLVIVTVASVTEELLLDGPGDVLCEAASVDMVHDGPCDVLGTGSVSPSVKKTLALTVL